MQQREGLLDDPAVFAQAGAVFGAASGDDRRDTDCLDLFAVLVVVIGAVGEQRVRLSARATAAAPHRWERVDQRHELGDVVAVTAGQRHLQRDTVPFGDQVVFRAGSGTVDRARSGFGPPFIARTCEPSITARDQSNWPAAFNSASRFSCNVTQTPASFQWCSRRQQVIPDPKPSSWGKNSHGMPV